MAVMVPRERWTDERLDEGFARLDKDIRELRSETQSLQREMNARFDKLNESFNARFDSMNDSMNARFDALNRNLIGGLFVVIAAMVGINVF